MVKLTGNTTLNDAQFIGMTLLVTAGRYVWILPVLQKPDVDIPILEGKELSGEMKRIADIQGINLSLPTPLSEEIIIARENNDW